MVPTGLCFIVNIPKLHIHEVSVANRYNIPVVLGLSILVILPT
jgi:hypothetical protein